jgi:hypothetical protein
MPSYGRWALDDMIHLSGSGSDDAGAMIEVIESRALWVRNLKAVFALLSRKSMVVAFIQAPLWAAVQRLAEL